MDLEHARTLARARLFVAALADTARCDDASSAFERVLVELDGLHGDESPSLATDGLGDRDVLYRGAMTAIESLVLFGLDVLDLELLLVRLETAYTLDGQ